MHDYARNSKGKNVLVKETGWAPADATPTHIVLQFSSSDVSVTPTSTGTRPAT